MSSEQPGQERDPRAGRPMTPRRRGIDRHERRSRRREYETVMVPFGASPSQGPAGGSTGGRRGTTRRRDRSSLRPLWWSMPIVVLASLASIALLGLHFWALVANHAWAQGDLDTAQSDYDTQVSVTGHGPERWVARYNSGTAMLARGDLDGGVTQLRSALELVPRATETSQGHLEAYSYECRVRKNLALGIEWQGDAAEAEERWTDAADYYDEVDPVLSPCDTSSTDQPQSGSSGGQDGGQPQSGGQSQSGDGSDGSDPGRDAGSARDRARQKSQDARDRAQDGDSSGSDDSDQNSEGQEDPSESPSPSPAPSESQSAGDPSDESSSAPSTSPTPDPFAGESDQERQRREELEKKLEQWQNEQNGSSDQNRRGNPDGGW